MRLMVVLVAVALAYLGFRWLARQPRKTRFQVAAVIIGTGLVFLAATGRLNWVFALIGLLLPFVRRLLALIGYLPVLQRLYRQFSGVGGGRPATGQQSTVETRFLRMVLDHDTGEMDGSILEGKLSGSTLSSLSYEQLYELFEEYDREDEESAQLLGAYLSRVHGDRWQQAEGSSAETGGDGFASDMTQREAYEILGLEEGADAQAIKAAHRRLMQRLHPDHGGSTFLASKINQAKDLLLRGR